MTDGLTMSPIELSWTAKKAPLWLSKCHCVTGVDLLGLENQVHIKGRHMGWIPDGG